MPRPDPDVRPRMKLPIQRLQGQLHTELVLLTGLQTWLVTDLVPHARRKSHCLLRVIAIGLVVLTYISGCLLTL